MTRRVEEGENTVPPPRSTPPSKPTTPPAPVVSNPAVPSPPRRSSNPVQDIIDRANDPLNIGSTSPSNVSSHPPSSTPNLSPPSSSLGPTPWTEKPADIQTIGRTTFVKTDQGIKQTSPLEIRPKPPEQLPQGYVRDLITHQIIKAPSWTPEEREYWRFKQAGPIQKVAIVFGSSVHNPIDFFGETPKFFYSALTSDRETAQKGYWNNFLGKEVMAGKKVWGKPLDTAGFIFESPYVNIPTFISGMGAIGYVKGLGTTGARIATGLNRGIALYTTKEMISGGKQAYEQGELPNYLFKTGVYVGVTAGLGTGFSNDIASSRFKIISKAVSESEKAKFKTQFEYMDKFNNLSSKSGKIFDARTILEESQAKNFTDAMNRLKYNNIKTVQIGSSLQPNYFEMTRRVHDIDIQVKGSGIFRSPVYRSEGAIKFRSPIDILPYDSYDNVFRAESIFDYYKMEHKMVDGKDWGFKKLDIHEYDPAGSPLNTRVSGYTESLMKTKKGNPFYYQTRLSEQALRKADATFAPLHELRGKDWVDVIDIASQKLNDEVLVSKMKKYKPELKEGTYEMIGPSYYESHPMEAPRESFTFFEKLYRKYGEPIKESDVFTDANPEQWVNEKNPYGPKFLKEKTRPPSWSKGITFFSSMTTGDFKGTRYNYLLSTGFPATTIKGYPESSIKEYGKMMPKIDYKPSFPKRTIYPVGDTGIDYMPPGITPYHIPSYTPEVKTPYIPSVPKYDTPAPPPYIPGIPSIPKYPSYKKTYDEPKIPPTIIPNRTIPPSINSKITNNEQESSGYDVYVKERSYIHGKKRIPESWKKANSTPLSEEAALSLGGSAIDNSAAASFKIKPSSGHAGKLKIDVSPWGAINYKFYKKGNTYIESTGSRIDSSGEIKGISALGWIASRQRGYSQPLYNQFKPVKTPQFKSIDVNKLMRGWSV